MPFHDLEPWLREPLAITQYLSLYDYTDDLDFYYAQLVDANEIVEVGAGIGRLTSHLFTSGLDSIFAIEPERKFRDALNLRMLRLGCHTEFMRDELGPANHHRTVIMPCNLLALVDDEEALRLLGAALRSNKTKLVFDVDTAKERPRLCEIGSQGLNFGSLKFRETSIECDDPKAVYVTQNLYNDEKLLTSRTTKIYFRPLDTYMAWASRWGHQFELYSGFQSRPADPSEEIDRSVFIIHSKE